MAASREPALLRVTDVTDPRSGARLCEAQWCMMAMYAKKQEGAFHEPEGRARTE